MSKSSKQKESSSLSIEDIQEQYKDSSQKIELEALEKKCILLEETIFDLRRDLEDRDLQISQLKKLAEANVPSFIPNIQVSDEEVIALQQLQKLKEASQIRPLSLEEIRMYDLLVKNKRLAQGNATENIETIKLPKDKSKLLELASKKLNVQEE